LFKKFLRSDVIVLNLLQTGVFDLLSFDDCVSENVFKIAPLPRLVVFVARIAFWFLGLLG